MYLYPCIYKPVYIMKKPRPSMSILSTQVPEEVAHSIRAQAEAMDVTPSWLMRKIIKSHIEENSVQNIKTASTK